MYWADTCTGNQFWGPRQGSGHGRKRAMAVHFPMPGNPRTPLTGYLQQAPGCCASPCRRQGSGKVRLFASAEMGQRTWAFVVLCLVFAGVARKGRCTTVHLCGTSCGMHMQGDGVCAGRASYRACPVANASRMLAGFASTIAPQRPQLAGACMEAVQLLACRTSYEVCEFERVTVPLCAGDAASVIESACGSAVARLVAEAPALAQLSAAQGSGTDTCAPMRFAEYSSWVWAVGLAVLVVADMITGVGAKMMLMGSWQAGARGSSARCNATWLTGSAFALAGVVGHTVALGMAPLAALAPLMALAVLAYRSQGGAGQPAGIGGWRAGAMLLLILCLLLLAPSSNPRYTLYGIAWLLSQDRALVGGVLCAAALLALAVVYTYAARSPTPAGLAVQDSMSPVHLGACAQLRSASTRVSALASAAGLLCAVGAVCGKGFVEIALGVGVGYKGQPFQAALPFILGAVWLAAACGQASLLSPTLQRSGSAGALGVYYAVVTFGTGVGGGAFWGELASVSSVRAAGYVALMALLAVVLASAVVPTLSWAGAPTPRVGSVGAGVPHRVALPNSTVLPPLPTAESLEAGSMKPSLVPGAIVPPGNVATAAPGTARRLLGWFNKASGDPFHYSAVGTEEARSDVRQERVASEADSLLSEQGLREGEYMLELGEFGEADVTWAGVAEDTAGDGVDVFRGSDAGDSDAEVRGDTSSARTLSTAQGQRSRGGSSSPRSSSGSSFSGSE